jgi:hypothetical protein
MNLAPDENMAQQVFLQCASVQYVGICSGHVLLPQMACTREMGAGLLLTTAISHYRPMGLGLTWSVGPPSVLLISIQRKIRLIPHLGCSSTMLFSFRFIPCHFCCE